MRSDFEKGAVQRNLTCPFTPATANGRGFLRPSANSAASQKPERDWQDVLDCGHAFSIGFSPNPPLKAESELDRLGEQMVKVEKLIVSSGAP
jgi:hypothetical protein